MREKSPSLLSRRLFIEKGLAGSALAALALTLPTGCASYRSRLTPEDAKRPLEFFTAKEYIVMLAAADAFLPDAKDAPNHRELGTVRKLDHELAQWDPFRAEDMHLLPQVLEHSTLAFGFSFSRFSNLPVDDRRAFLSTWADSDLALKRTGFIAIKGLLAFYYYADPKLWPVVGYDGPWIERFAIPITPVKGLPA